MSEEILNHDTDENLADFITESDRVYDIKEVVTEKLIDAMTPGFMVEFDPDEAEFAGAFVEDALSEEDALESAYDLAHDR